MIIRKLNDGKERIAINVSDIYSNLIFLTVCEVIV